MHDGHLGTTPRARGGPGGSCQWLAVVLGMLTAVASLCLGCGPVPGVGDVALDFRVVGEAPTASALHRAVAARLGAARIAADIDVVEAPGPANTTLHLVVDRDSAEVVRDLLLWRGGLSLAAAIDHETPRVDRIDRVERAVSQAGEETHVRYVIEPIGPDLARMRAVEKPPLGTIERASLNHVEVGDDGKSLVFDLDAAGKAVLERVRGAAGVRPMLMVRDDSVVGPIDTSKLTVSVGDGLYAYTRADRLRTLLTTPALPTLEATGTRTMAPDWLALILGIFLPLLLSCGWLAFVRRFDRLHPEPLWLVGAVFALGIASVAPAALVELGWSRLSIALNPTYATLGGRLSALPYALGVFALVVGLTEEGSKLCAALVVRRRKEFDEPIDGIVYGVAASLGFAAAENVKFFATGRLAPSLIVARTFTSIPAHLFFGAIWGYALGQTLLPGRGKGFVVRALLIAALLHGAFDALLSTRGMAPAALLLNFALATTFVVLVRRALRRGAIDRDAERSPLSVERSTVVRVGSPLVFWLGALGVHVGALAAVVLGAVAEGSGSRPGPAFFAASTAALAILIVSAWTLSATLPLDVVVDVDGVTFAGSLRRWERVSGMSTTRVGPLHYVRIMSSDGDLLIGPGSPHRMIALEAALATRCASVPPPPLAARAGV